MALGFCVKEEKDINKDKDTSTYSFYNDETNKLIQLKNDMEQNIINKHINNDKNIKKIYKKKLLS